MVLLLIAAPTEGAGDECIVLDDFTSTAAGEFPGGWKVRKDAGRAVYSIHAEGGLRFLRASARGMGIQAGRERGWNLGEFPVLSWKWRPRVFPSGADEQSGKNDSALAVYAVFPHNVVAAKALKYVWSERVPRGTPLESNAGLTQVLVLESGAPASNGTWVEERVNVAEDYRRRFNDRALPKPSGIAVLTDSDDTRSFAEGDYADFRACRG